MATDPSVDLCVWKVIHPSHATWQQHTVCSRVH